VEGRIRGGEEMYRKKLRKGLRVKVIGNTIKKGTVLGKFQDCYVIKFDKPYKIGPRSGKTIISSILAHPDNISDF
jgi:hypothetical protein